MNQDPNFEQNEEIKAEPLAEEASVQKREPSSSFAKSAFEILEMFAWSVFVVLLLFTFCLRLTRVDGSSMENTLLDGQNLLVTNIAYTPKQDDIIVFHITNPEDGLEKAMVKRVIATGGQHLRIDFNTGEITVDGEVYQDEHAVLKDLGGRHLGYYLLSANHHYSLTEDLFEATVPEGTLFVMGDNRNNSKDSRNSDVGFVDERSVLGKAIVRIYPFTVFN